MKERLEQGARLVAAGCVWLAIVAIGTATAVIRRRRWHSLKQQWRQR